MTNKLTNAEKSSKAYWSILKRFLNNKKIPVIPPLFYENSFITNFKEKAELFNSFFADQCSLMSNASKLPSNFTLYTDNRPSAVTFSQDDIGKIFQNLNPNKDHDHDNISIRMLKIFSSSIYGPLELIFKEDLSTGLFPSNWKKGSIVPIPKKGDKPILKNYRPVSLLPICGKIFERLIFNELFNFLLENNFISRNQSGFKPGDSCINQLLSITHEIYNSFDEGLEVRTSFWTFLKPLIKCGTKTIFLNCRKMVYLVTS